MSYNIIIQQLFTHSHIGVRINANKYDYKKLMVNTQHTIDTINDSYS